MILQDGVIYHSVFYLFEFNIETKVEDPYWDDAFVIEVKNYSGKIYEESNEDTKLLSDFIPGAVYDGSSSDGPVYVKNVFC